MDNTKDALASYADRIKYVYKENGGACSARNLGIKLSSGEYIGLLDCDDLYLPEKVEKAVRCLEDNPEFGFVHTAACFIDDEGGIIRDFSAKERKKEGWISGRLLKRNFICNSTVIARRSCFEKAGFFDEEIFIPADWDMWLRLAEKYQAGYIDESLTKHRNPESYTRNNLQDSKDHGMVVLNKTFQRNPDMDKGMKLKAVSNHHYRHARYYGKIGEHGKSREELTLALKNNKLNVKALLFFAALSAGIVPRDIN